MEGHLDHIDYYTWLAKHPRPSSDTMLEFERHPTQNQMTGGEPSRLHGPGSWSRYGQVSNNYELDSLFII